MPRLFAVIATFLLLSFLGLSGDTNVQAQDGGGIYSEFEVVNMTGGRVEIQIFENADKSCSNWQSKRVVAKKSRKVLHCTNDVDTKNNRCKIRVKHLGKDQMVCKDLRNECDKIAIRVPDESRILILTDESKDSGVTCRTFHDVTFGGVTPEPK